MVNPFGKYEHTAKGIHHVPQVGLGHAAAYQVSGVPFLTGSDVIVAKEVKIEFPRVTKSFTVVCTGTAPVRVHFDSKSNPAVYGGNHYITLTEGTAYGFDVKCREVYISAPPAGDGGANTGFQLGAEITSIGANEMIMLSGSGINT
tara:strand:+ start:699 stop:1136 length:438 start_codon:yes stop_codon:yes gene_type:complete